VYSPGAFGRECLEDVHPAQARAKRGRPPAALGSDTGWPVPEPAQREGIGSSLERPHTRGAPF